MNDASLHHLSNSPTGKQWEKVGIKHHHGINIPLFALHSNNSCGIGEFSDLLPLLPWCVEVGFDVIQLLPLNDTGDNTSPYSSLSAFALNPIHLGLTSLPKIDCYPELLESIKKLKRLNNSQRIDYPLVYKEKNLFLKNYFIKEFDSISANPKYHDFTNHHSWLTDYALFKTLKIVNHLKSWEQWGELFKNPSSDTLKRLKEQYANEINFHIFVQYLCFEQLINVKNRANILGIFLKGDIPILINRDCADVWIHRPLFDLNLSAGSVPDKFNSEGQNWGFPLYNWDKMTKELYDWWKVRLGVAAELYDIYRIDHIVGFFRIWGIPLGKKGNEGKFIPENESVWISHGRSVLSMMVEASTMLPIGEDLGTVPPGVRTCLKQLGICGTKVIRWERKWHDEDQPYIQFYDYLPESMTTVSTHDTDPLQLWWTSTQDEAKAFAKFKGWTYTNKLNLDQLFEILKDSHHTASLFHINLLNEYLALFSNMIWPKPEDNRINIPGIISDRNWTYRFRPSVEAIVSNTALQEMIKNLIAS